MSPVDGRFQVWTTKRAFPDLKIHITDSFCVGNDVDGYKTTMPDVAVLAFVSLSRL